MPKSGYRLPDDADGTVGTCKDCRCWYHETVPLSEISTGLKLAQCRRYPPNPTETSGPWPWANPNEWCGEFRP